MKLVNTNGLDIEVPKGSAFAYKTDAGLPKAHMVTLAVGKRGSGKSVAVTNLMKHLKFDKIICVSPTFKSNSKLMRSLNIEEEDIFEDPDDPTIVDQIISKINEERDELELYLEQMKEYRNLLKMLSDNSTIPDEMLLSFYRNGNFEPPQHKYGGRNPFIGLLIDDCQSSKLFSSKRIQNMTIKSRHIGSFKSDRPSIGISMFFLVQNYRVAGGQGCPRSVRNNATNALIFKNKDLKELDNIAGEMAGEVSKERFIEAYDTAMEDGEHPFLFVDLHKKEHHPSMFRSRFNKFIV